MKIIIDAFGGDNAPSQIIEGALLALYNNKDLNVTFVGKEEEIKNELMGKGYDESRVSIVNATEVIDCDEAPVEAIRTKKDSSMVVAIDKLKNDSSYAGMLSAGSTGALLSGAVLKLGRVKGLNRPTLAPILPTVLGGKVLIVDSGANMDCKPINLAQFALIGNVYMQKVLGIEKPRVALLSVGVEDAKGNELIKNTLPILKQLPINFVGNMEACDLLSGKYDIVVCDGFSGNVLLKSTEGTVKNLLSVVKSAMKSTFVSKMGALLIKKPLKNTLKQFDQSALGGSPFLGVKRLVVKAHGSSKAAEIYSTINQLVSLASLNLTEEIEKVILSVHIDENGNVTVDNTLETAAENLAEKNKEENNKTTQQNTDIQQKKDSES